MSYDLGLYYYPNRTPARIESHYEGGTICLDGREEAEINLTYNYGSLFRQALDPDEGLRWLYGKTGAETVETLQAAVDQLGTERYAGPYYVVKPDAIFSGEYPADWKGLDFDAPENADKLREGLERGWLYDTGGYWKATPGNAGYHLNILLEWAKQHPTAVWEGD